MNHVTENIPIHIPKQFPTIEVVDYSEDFPIIEEKYPK